MDPIRTIRLRWAHGTLSDVSLLTASLSQFAPPSWRPSINAYRCQNSFRICVDLAGVERSNVDLQIEPQRLTLRGERDISEPNDEEGCVLRTLHLEIDYGPFLRVIELPDEIDIERATAEQENGLLWIILPFRKS